MNKDLALLDWYRSIGIDEIISYSPERKNIKFAMSENQENYHTNDLSFISPHQLVQIAREQADNINDLEALKNAVFKFDGLSIKKTATNTVFADGNPLAKIMAIGEAPGANEDLQGIPFCGQSGKLLDKMLSFVGLTRSTNLYITNSIFWRPPGNRKPTLEENMICLPFVEKHIALIKPKLLILIGSNSAQSILKSNESVSLMRTKTYNYINAYLTDPIPAVVLFHPSYLLRQPSQKKIFWNDLLKIKKKFLNELV